MPRVSYRLSHILQGHLECWKSDFNHNRFTCWEIVSDQSHQGWDLKKWWPFIFLRPRVFLKVAQLALIVSKVCKGNTAGLSQVWEEIAGTCGHFYCVQYTSGLGLELGWATMGSRDQSLTERDFGQQLYLHIVPQAISGWLLYMLFLFPSHLAVK